jgi:hypothetical protein
VRKEDLIAGLLFAIPILCVLIPLYTIVFTFPREVVRWFYPLGDPIFFGGVLIVPNCIIMIVSRYQMTFSDYMKLRYLKISIIGLILGFGLWPLAFIPTTLENLVIDSALLFIIGILGFAFIPPRYPSLKV